MNQEFEENGLVEEEIQMPVEEKKFEPSWPKAFCWVALAMSVIVPIIAVGVGIMCISSAQEKEKNEVSIISGIAIGIAAVLLFNTFIASISSLTLSIVY